MGNTVSADAVPETPGLVGKLGGITAGRAAAITEGKARKGLPKLPPNALKSQPDDWPFVEVRQPQSSTT